jgi:predicted secreted protein
VTTRVVTLEADGTTVDVAPGERLELRLPENAGTGYLWILEPPGPPVTVAEEALRPPAAARAGAAGEHRFVLHAGEPGETTLVARHARPWAPESELGRFRLTVRVR